MTMRQNDKRLQPPYTPQLMNKFISDNIKTCPDADRGILQFISEILYHGAPHATNTDSAKTIRHLFQSGYCWYFAHMLDMAFKDLNGQVCLAAPFGHFVYVCNEVPYDISGVYKGISNEFIPESFLGDTLLDFMHVPYKEFSVTKEQMDQIIEDYRKSIRKE